MNSTPYGAAVVIPLTCLVLAGQPAEAKPPQPTVTYDVTFQIEGNGGATCNGGGCNSDEIRESRLDATKHIWVKKLDMTNPLGGFLRANVEGGPSCFATDVDLTGEILIQDVNNSPREINARYFFDALDKNRLKSSYAFTMRCWVDPDDDWLPGVIGAPNSTILDCDEWSIGINGRKRKNADLCSVDRPQDFSDSPMTPTTITVTGPQ